MGREVRMVPIGWEHPTNDRGPIPLMNRDILDYYEDGDTLPEDDELMPVFPEGSATQFMMYETWTEGTPISPSFSTPEELARWLADNGASSFGSMTASYDQWLATIREGSAYSMIADSKGMRSGVEFNAEDKEKA